MAQELIEITAEWRVDEASASSWLKMLQHVRPDELAGYRKISSTWMAAFVKRHHVDSLIVTFGRCSVHDKMRFNKESTTAISMGVDCPACRTRHEVFVRQEDTPGMGERCTSRCCDKKNAIVLSAVAVTLDVVIPDNGS